MSDRYCEHGLIAVPGHCRLCEQALPDDTFAVGTVIDWSMPPEPPPGTHVVDREGDRWSRTHLDGASWRMHRRRFDGDGPPSSLPKTWAKLLGFAPLIVIDPSSTERSTE